MPTEEWKKRTPDFHLDPKKDRDPVESLVEKLGTEGAFDELADQLENNPDDPEVRRRATLLVNRLEDLTNKLKAKLSH